MEIRRAVQEALAEDVRSGDVTSEAVIPAAARSSARMVTREPMVAAGLAFAVETFRALDPAAVIEAVVPDGFRLPAGASILRVTGASRALLTAERTALNFVQRLSGIATATAAFVDAVAGTRARILDTRKTTPGWRVFEKYAVACGGGTNHRHGLDDLVLIKDNHLAALQGASPNPIAVAVERARARYPYLKVEVEADTLDQVAQALAAGAEIILLDNMSPAQLTEAVRLCAGRALTEASGGVRLETVRAIAETGVDFISAGALTHSVRAIDIGLDFEASPGTR
ncbi:MAG: carboxylating nicotinate-nucleotide diphosphorylase [Limisphaerales bacterium]